MPHEGKIIEGADGSISNDQCNNKISANTNSLSISELKTQIKTLQSNVKGNTAQVNMLNKQIHKNHINNANKNNEAVKSASKGVPS